MLDETPDFAAILRVLETAGVRFVLVGGLAMVAHGSDHVTQDIDVGYSRDIANMNVLASALAPYHPQLRGAPAGLPFILDLRTLKSVLNLTLLTDLGPVDLLGEAAGVSSFEKLWERSVVLEVEGVRIRVASLDDLIAMKRAAGRPKDQQHLRELEALRALVQDGGQGN